jgi:hypothetical protein
MFAATLGRRADRRRIEPTPIIVVSTPRFNAAYTPNRPGPLQRDRRSLSTTIAHTHERTRKPR